MPKRRKAPKRTHITFVAAMGLFIMFLKLTGSSVQAWEKTLSHDYATLVGVIAIFAGLLVVPLFMLWASSDAEDANNPTQDDIDRPVR